MTTDEARLAGAAEAAGTLPTDPAALAAALMHARQTILPKRLVEPGPDEAQLQAIFEAAATAPDHGRLLPWRFVIVPREQRSRLAGVFAQSLLERDREATPAQVEQAREKAYRAPLLLLVAVDGQRGDAGIDLAERILSAGCAVQNMLLMATALGYGSAITSGRALKSPGLAQLFSLAEGEHALCFVSIGSVEARKRERERPPVADFTSRLDAS